MNYTISVKPVSRKPVPEKEKIYLSTHFNQHILKCSVVYSPVQFCSGPLLEYPSLQTHLNDPLVFWHNELVALQLCFPVSHSFMSEN